MTTIEKEQKYFLQTYKRIPIEIDHADGVYIFSRDGKKYLDFFGGLAVNALGYNNARVKRSIVNQIDRYMHMSNMFLLDIQVEFGELLCELSGYPKVFLTNSGAESIEAAAKLSRKWGNTRAKQKLVALTNSFHGRTYGALSLTDREKYRMGYEPFLPEVDHVLFNDVEDLGKKVDDKTAAVFVEFIQGEGGINVLSDEFVDALFSLRSKFGFLVVADEVQSGVFRTGKFFAFEHYGVRPDIVTVAKPIGGGLPLGAILVDDHLADVMSYGSHGTTFGGNPVSCAAGVATLKELVENKIDLHVQKIGGYLKMKLLDLKNKYPDFISDVRGLGLMVGIDCKTPCSDFVDKLLSNGVLANCTNTTVIRLLPPLIVKEEHIDILVETLEHTISQK